MRRTFSYFIAFSLFFALSSFSVSTEKKSKKEAKMAASTEKVLQRYENIFKSVNYDMEKFLNLSPKEYRKLTGEKLSLKEGFELKIVQKQLKKQMTNGAAAGGGLPKWAYIVLSIIALGWLAIGIQSDFTGNDWWISLLLYFLFIIPGIIYSLIVMKKYY